MDIRSGAKTKRNFNNNFSFLMVTNFRNHFRFIKRQLLMEKTKPNDLKQSPLKATIS